MQEYQTLCLPVDAVARRLGISRGLAYELANSPGFPAVRIGRRLLVPVAGLERWLAEQSGGECRAAIDRPAAGGGAGG